MNERCERMSERPIIDIPISRISESLCVARTRPFYSPLAVRRSVAAFWAFSVFAARAQQHVTYSIVYVSGFHVSLFSIRSSSPSFSPSSFSIRLSYLSSLSPSPSFYIASRLPLSPSLFFYNAPGLFLYPSRQVLDLFILLLCFAFIHFLTFFFLSAATH